jgi:hypothetical protein
MFNHHITRIKQQSTVEIISAYEDICYNEEKVPVPDEANRVPATST